MSLSRVATASRQPKRSRQAERSEAERKYVARVIGTDNSRAAGSPGDTVPADTRLADDRATASDASPSAELYDDQVLAAHIRALRRYAYTLVGGSAIADDLVQETLARAIFYLRAGREVRNLRSYLLTTLHNVRVDHIKSDRRQGDLLPLDEHPQLAVPAAQLDKLACNEAAAAIAALPEEQRAVLLLIGLEGLSYQEATDILGVPIGTVMSRLNRGRNAVKAQLDRDATAKPAPAIATRRSSPANTCDQ